MTGTDEDGDKQRPAKTGTDKEGDGRRWKQTKIETVEDKDGLTLGTSKAAAPVLLTTPLSDEDRT